MLTNEWLGKLESCQNVLRRDPNHLGALETLAQAQWFGGLYDAVIATTSRLLKLNPLEPGYRYTRGMAYLSKGELTRAHQDFQTALNQSDDQEFRAQVQRSIDALERWMIDTPRLGTPWSNPGGERPS